MKKAPKWEVLSPDGFTIERSPITYRSLKMAMLIFNQWKERYKAQGYYSSSRCGRIPLDQLQDYCKFTNLNAIEQ